MNLRLVEHGTATATIEPDGGVLVRMPARVRVVPPVDRVSPASVTRLVPRVPVCPADNEEFWPDPDRGRAA